MTVLLPSSGILRYRQPTPDTYRVSVEVERDFTEYYRSLIPPHIDTRGQRHDSHITVVRPFRDVPPDLAAWGRHEGEVVEFVYDHEIQCGHVYFWLNVFSTHLEEIREELGMIVDSPYAVPPPGYRKTFHCTIANIKPR